MNKLITKEYMEHLLQKPEFNILDAIYPGAGMDESFICEYPDEWSDLINPSYESGVLERYWMTKGSRFERLPSILEKKVQHMAIARYRESKQCCLLYFFLQKGEVRIWVGNLPTTIMPELLINTKIDFTALYGIHNGFYDFEYGEPGFVPVESVEVYKDADVSGENGFLKIFGHGTAALGIDLDSDNSDAYIIWGSDEEIEEVEDIWVELDGWMFNLIEEFDDNN